MIIYSCFYDASSVEISHIFTIIPYVLIVRYLLHRFTKPHLGNLGRNGHWILGNTHIS